MTVHTTALFYEYFTWIDDFDSAEKILDMYYRNRKADGEKVKFSILSDRSNDFIPVLRYGMKKTRSIIAKDLFQTMLQS